jgi:hypothetical protein
MLKPCKVTLQKYPARPTKNTVKIKNKRELKHYLQQHEQNNITIKQAANHLKITPRRSKQLYHQHKTTNTTPTIGKNLGRPKKQSHHKQ